MLAQNFKTPAELQITDAEFEALVKVLGMLERGDIKPSKFSMHHPGDQDTWTIDDCGTPACIAGWARYVAGDRIFDRAAYSPSPYSQELSNLFMMGRARCDWPASPFLATPHQAAIALRGYLTTGQTRWDEALAD